MQRYLIAAVLVICFVAPVLAEARSMKAEVPLQPTVERQSLFNVTYLERYGVETNGARFSCFSHGTLQQLVKDLKRYSHSKQWPNTI
jgi:hypothetical protein